MTESRHVTGGRGARGHYFCGVSTEQKTLTNSAVVASESSAAMGQSKEASFDPGTTAAPTVEWGAMTEGGLHHPIIGRRKRGSTVALLRRWRDLWAIYAKRRVDPIFREEIMLAVAGADSSRQCSFAHREWARSVHIPEDELTALEGLDTESLDERRWAAFAWAQAYARSDLTDAPDTVETTLQQRFAAQERSDIELAARTMYWLNETSNSFDALLSRLKRKKVTGSTLLTEFVALVLYAIAVPILIIMFSIMQRRNPISIIRAMKPFFREFERRGPNTISGPGEKFAG